jgi:hypothetical protein
MQLIELTEPEQRLALYDVLSKNSAGVKANRCFYISHKTHYPDFSLILESAVEKIRGCKPTKYDQVIIDRSTEAGTKFDKYQASKLYELCDSEFNIENIVYVSQASYNEAFNLCFH